MKIVRSVKQLSEIVHSCKTQKKRIGFVPTMGFLHEGHLTLVRRAKAENEIVVASIFVNPTQFGPHEDFKKYPRNIPRDRKMLEKEGVDILFLPTFAGIYPGGFNGYIEPGPLAKGLCGQKRPGHFRGVTTVVNRLFELVQPDRAYFGKKDYQQARVIEDMVRRFRLRVKIVFCELIRDFDGIAMSSRNKYLSAEERIKARALYRSLQKANALVRLGERDAGRIKKDLRTYLGLYVKKIDYVEIVNPRTLKRVKRISGSVLVAIACFVGKTRLIDNMRI